MAGMAQRVAAMGMGDAPAAKRARAVKCMEMWEPDMFRAFAEDIRIIFLTLPHW